MRRLICVLAAVIVALASGAQPASAQAPIGAALGLGTAGGPFGPAIDGGDLNGDGARDLVVADVLGGTPGDWTYQISLDIHGHGVRRATFASPQPSLALRVIDIDGDRDLDIVAVVPVLGAPAAVWLNDGQGHFSAGDVRRYSTTPPPRKRLDAASVRDRAPTPGSLPERSPLDASRVTLPVPSPARILTASTTVDSPTAALAQASPRGPPSTHA